MCFFGTELFVSGHSPKSFLKRFSLSVEEKKNLEQKKKEKTAGENNR